MHIFKIDDPQTEIVHFDTDIPVDIPETYQEKPFRAVWVSNVVNIDMPVIEDIKHYQNKFLEILDTCETYRLNAIFFQCRTSNDAFYESKLNPYSRYLTGKEGKKPPFDVFKWMIEETHKRHIEFHAWMNPYRVSTIKAESKSEWLDTCDDLNFAKRHQELTISDKEGKLILNPARSEVREFIKDTVVELISQYPVDGVHFDDYFYPYGGPSEHDNDLKEYEHRKEIDLSLDEFRRHEVTKAIRMVYQAIKSFNPSLRFGISPFGIWRKKTDDFKTGANVHPSCSESYKNEYADSYRWVEEGIVDYICPQIYFDFEHKLAPFADLVDWWTKALEGKKVDLYIGFGPYRYGNKGGYENPLEVANQLKYANQYDFVKGNVFFTYHTFVDEGISKPGMEVLKRLFNKEG